MKDMPKLSLKIIAIATMARKHVSDALKQMHLLFLDLYTYCLNLNNLHLDYVLDCFFREMVAYIANTLIFILR
jgi:hypothetical protein